MDFSFLEGLDLMRLPLRLLIAALLMMGLALSVGAAEVPIPPAPARWATDTAGFLSPDALSMADRLLQSFEQGSKHQVLLYIAPTTGDTPTEDWAVKAFAAWKVGDKKLDDGLVLFVFAKDHKVRIEVGYGLEDKVPDAIASRIIAETIVPRIQAGDNDGAVIQGLTAILAAIEPSMVQGAGTEGSARRLDEATKHLSEVVSDLTLGQKIIIGLLILGFIILLITHPSMALWLLFSLLSGGRGGGGGGGGFSGGGGSSGGGGATGSW